MSAFENEKRAAIAAVVKACRLTVNVQNSLISEDTITKKDRSPVTVADFGSQAIVINELTRQFDYPFIAEESSKQLEKQPDVRAKVTQQVRQFIDLADGEAGEQQLMKIIESGNRKSVDARHWWALDPVDGTLGFLRRGQYAIALALFEGFEPVLGVLGCPALPASFEREQEAVGWLLVAVKGQGAFALTIEQAEAGQQASRLAVSGETNAANSNRAESFEQSHSSHSLTDVIAAELGTSREPLRIDSQCKYSVVARGEATMYLRLSSLSYQEKIWDHAAGVLIVEEAGGRVTDFNGNRLDFSRGSTLSGNTGIVCTNGHLHERVLQAIKQVKALELVAK